MRLQPFVTVFFYCLILAGPWLAGALSIAVFLPVFLFGAIFAVLGFVLRIAFAEKAALVFASAALTVFAADGALRCTTLVPTELIEDWPRLPLVKRYLPSVNYHGSRFNDLARMAGNASWLEAKQVTIITDQRGLRNSPARSMRPLDLVLIGDSFGAGAVSQEFTWTEILAREYRLSTYNLSTPASGPWQQLINFTAEKDRLETSENSWLLWEIFIGNDLDEPYGTLDFSTLPWSGSFAAYWNSLKSVRARSPVRKLLERHQPSREVVDRRFLNGRTLLFYRPYIERSSRAQAELQRHPNFESLKRVIAGMQAAARSKKMKLAIVFVPSKEEVYDWVWKGTPPWTTEDSASAISLALRQLTDDLGVPALDLKPIFVRESRNLYAESQRLLYWYDDSHLNVEGNMLVSAMMHEQILAQSAKAN